MLRMLRLLSIAQTTNRREAPSEACMSEWHVTWHTNSRTSSREQNIIVICDQERMIDYRDLVDCVTFRVKSSAMDNQARILGIHLRGGR